MAVIVQQMTHPRLAGVAFTQGNETIIESAQGPGDRLVAGLADATRTAVPHGHEAASPYQQIARLAEELRTRLDGDADIEWAWDDELYLLQVRRVTTAVHNRATGPVFTHASLYLDDTLPPDLPLSGCTDVYLAYTAKRAPLYRLAESNGIRTGRGWVVGLNGIAVNDPSLHPDWWDTLTARVVVDLGANLRQHILPAAELPAFLTDALNLKGDPTTVHSLIIREFTQGEAGIVTHRNEAGETVMEHAPQGLLAINRGLTEPERQVLPPLEDSEAWEQTTTPDGWAPDSLHQLARFTQTVDEQLPGSYAEWVLNQGQPQFVDVSVIEHGSTAEATSSGTTISPGTAQGPLLHLDDTEELTKLSIAPIISVNFRADTPQSTYIARLQAKIRALPARPIIYTRRPYVILSLLIDDVAGFVFDGGSLLCHLAILLREAGTPAVITPEPLEAADLQRALISNGTIAVST